MAVFFSHLEIELLQRTIFSHSECRLPEITRCLKYISLYYTSIKTIGQHSHTHHVAGSSLWHRLCKCEKHCPKFKLFTVCFNKFTDGQHSWRKALMDQLNFLVVRDPWSILKPHEIYHIEIKMRVRWHCLIQPSCDDSESSQNQTI